MSEIYNEIQIIQKAFSHKELIIFDVGACDFNDSIRFRENFLYAEIYSFEPDITNLKNCPQKVYDYQINVVPVALSDVDDLVKFYSSISFGGNEHKASGSLLKPKTKPNTSEGFFHDTLLFDLNGYDIQTVRIDTFCKLNDISNIDFLHMDVQGAEYKVLNGLGDIRPVFIFAETCEFETYESNITLETFDSYMKDLGYEIVKRFRDDTLYKLKSYSFDFSNINWLAKL